MSWAKLDDHFPTHPKVVKAGGDAGWLHVCAICYCAEHLTDGFFVKELVPRLSDRANPLALAQRLVDADLWVEHESQYEIVDYLQYNPSRAQVEAERQWARARRELHSNSALTEAIKRRDADKCRYCGLSVSWTDRRGKRGATYDHVVPRGNNSLENVVIACRACNMRKADRTPEQAGMELLPVWIPSSSDLVPIQPPVPVPESPTDSLGRTSAPSRGTRIPDQFVIDDEMRAWAEKNCPNIDVSLHTQRFVNHFKASSGRNAVKLDWVRTWQNWLLKEEDRVPGYVKRQARVQR